MMELRYPSDFQRVRPWGRQGDEKNDGYLRSERTVFQVYAPDSMSSSAAVKKIDDDFAGCLPYWAAHFDHWTFVHNSLQGLPPEVVRRLLDLDQNDPPQVRVTSWGFAELRKVCFQLSAEDLALVLGAAPSSEAFLELGFDQIQQVIDVIARQEPDPSPDLRPVPSEKLQANGLSEEIGVLLRSGMRRSDSVGEFFAKYYDPQLGGRVAQTFRSKYHDLRSTINDPDLIFLELQHFAGGRQRSSPHREAAVLAVLAYLFEECEIFERPPP